MTLTPYPLRADTKPRAVWPSGLTHLEHLTMAQRTFPTEYCRPATCPQWITGTEALLCGMPVVVHRNPDDPAMWQVSEPLTGANIIRVSATRKDALSAARRRVESLGGLGALLHNMAHRPNDAPFPWTTLTGLARVPAHRLHSPELAYLAGGPLDAPDWIPAGSTKTPCIDIPARSRVAWNPPADTKPHPRITLR